MTSDQMMFAWIIVCAIPIVGVLVACTDCFPLGRLNRRWFFMTFFGGAMIVGLGVWALNAIAASRLQPTLAWTLAIPVFLAVVLGLAVWCGSPLLRIHDLGLPGWYYFGLAVPIVQFAFMGALFLWPGSKEPNRYGARNQYLQRGPVETVAPAPM